MKKFSNQNFFICYVDLKFCNESLLIIIVLFIEQNVQIDKNEMHINYISITIYKLRKQKQLDLICKVIHSLV